MSSRLALPDSDMACAARQFLFDVSPVPVAHHSVRSYLFARELAAAKGLYPDVDYDDELVYLSCVLHDLGVTDYAVAQMGIAADIVGAERQLLPTGFADAVHAEWPRYDIGYALAELIARQVEDNPAKGPSLTLPGHLRQLYYPTTPAVTWFDIVRAAGWNDQPGAAGSAESSGQGTVKSPDTSHPS